MNAGEYEQFENTCLAELETKRQQTAEILMLTPAMDLSQEVIQFLDGEEVFVEAKVVPIGSWGTQTGSWVWGWANAYISEPLRTRASALKELSVSTGRKEFESVASVKTTAREAWGFVAVACHHLDGVGVYELYDNDLVFFLLIRELNHFKSPDSLLEIAQKTLARAILGNQGAQLLNLVRKRFPELRVNLMGADLRGEPQPWAHDLHAQILFDLDRIPTHQPNDLSKANLSQSRFDDAIMRKVPLRGASFEGSSLVDADLSGADVSGASFRNAFLNGANFTRAKLKDADFTGAELARTLLTDVDLSEVKGLDEVHHSAPSEISLSTLIASRFEIAPTFLRKAGVSRGLIEDLMKGKEFSNTYQTCFLSYSSKDRDFAAQLYDSLAGAGVRVFWDYFDVIPGEYLNDQILEAIRQNDRLLVVLSPNSMASEWVKREIELAWYHKRDSLIPVRLTPIEDIQEWTKTLENFPDLASLFPVLNFSGWKSPGEYDHAFSLLIKSFSGGVDFRDPKKGNKNM